MKHKFRVEYLILAVLLIFLVILGITRMSHDKDSIFNHSNADNSEGNMLADESSALDSENKNKDYDEEKWSGGTSEVSVSTADSPSHSLETSEEAKKKLGIFVDGEVKHPGFYELEQGCRIQHALEKAGGITDQADMSKVNPAALLQDEMKITIPSIENNDSSLGAAGNDAETVIEPNPVVIGVEGSAVQGTNGIQSRSQGEASRQSLNTTSKLTNSSEARIDINRASLEELMMLPSIGENKAKKIIEYREKTPFHSIEEIQNISGIGTKIYEQIAPLISVQ